MKAILFLSISLLGFTAPTKRPAASAPVASARAAVVMEQQTRTTLYSHNATLVRTVASVSKIMTAIVAIENSSPQQMVTIPADIKKAVGSMIYVRVGDRASIEELLYGLMLRSGNDAAISLAVAVSTSIPQFVDLMNTKASELGMSNSTFRNPHGLDEFDGGNLSCAKDLALLMAHAMGNDYFRQIAGSKEYFAPNLKMKWHNKNRLLSSYSHTTGGKTGYTKLAKRTLVTAAKINQTELIVVTLDCGSDFNFHKNMYEYYFARYQTRLILAKGEYIYNYNKFTSDRDYYFFADNTFWKKAMISIEIDEQNSRAELALYSDGGRVVVAKWQCEKVEKVNKKSWWDKIGDFFKGLFS